MVMTFLHWVMKNSGEKKKDRNLGIHYIYEKPGKKKTKILQYTTLTERQVR